MPKLLHTKNILLLIGIFAGIASLLWVVWQLSGSEISEPKTADVDLLEATTGEEISMPTTPVPQNTPEPLTTIEPKDDKINEENSDEVVYEDDIGKFSIAYPREWKVVTGMSEPDSLGSIWFVAPGRELDIIYPGETMIVIRENSENLPLDEYYEKPFAINLFETSEIQENVEIAGIQGKKFSKVQGLSESVIAAVVHEGQVIEFHDISTTHQDDQIWQNMLTSLSWL